ncbi:TetR/AcrR family transcriptional regulator [Peterkaempfera sp. SMS 1(5)a]|uniref:TetR/AcrR family transcriptional regulator n=1 Tax=Peterkaempfera podocarpi TaxID=3232308 RepID=UPI00366C1B07
MVYFHPARPASQGFRGDHPVRSRFTYPSSQDLSQRPGSAQHRTREDRGCPTGPPGPAVRPAARTTARPHDRRAQIVAAAMEHFHASGYQATCMEEIAAAVGITAGALYRHFRGKQELLGHSLLGGLDLLSEAASRDDDLDSLLRTVACFCLDHRSHVGLWSAETRNLSDDHRAEARMRTVAIASLVTTALRAARPELAPADAELTSRAVLCLLAGPSFHRTELPRPRFENLLCEQTGAVCRTAALPPVSPCGAPAPRPAPGLRPFSRREALLTAAVPLLRRHGFQNVGMEEIGTAAGFSGRTVYQRFAGKADLFAAALRRESDALKYGLLQILAESSTPGEALQRALEAYAASAVARGPVALPPDEASHLPTKERRVLRRLQVDYVAELVALTACRPELTEAEARVAVHSSLTLVTLMVRSPLVRQRTNPPRTLAVLALQGLGFEEPD